MAAFLADAATGFDGVNDIDDTTPQPGPTSSSGATYIDPYFVSFTAWTAFPFLNAAAWAGLDQAFLSREKWGLIA
jgi:hypothetical protein